MAVLRYPITVRLSVAVAALLLCACDGYPSEDTVPPNPFDIGNAQRLQALDALGAKALRGERSRFALDEACTLRVVRSGGPQRERFEQALAPGMHVGISFDKAERVFEVHLLSDSGPHARRLGLLLRSSAWMQAAQADLLVQLMIRDCAGVAALTAAPQPPRTGPTTQSPPAPTATTARPG
ncbi:hypothetical protein [Roseateles sp.]|uniref:hypothetical protein n=1 Tax=Roseateles sp. TaxID=1971397 RepID=UPI0025DD2BF5|nr:hypothetical protein [Roseateles sp.]MBV8035178.1 hypothetical protein [Roseateles sp.]